jgi:hypothetical protein
MWKENQIPRMMAGSRICSVGCLLSPVSVAAMGCGGSCSVKKRTDSHSC